MIMVAVQDFDADASFSHPAREQAELTGHVLLQSLNKHFPFREDADASPFQCPARSGAVREEKMGNALAANDPSSAALDTYPGATQSLSHIGKSAGSILQGDC